MFTETRGSVPGAKKNEKIGQAAGLRERKMLQRPETQYSGQRKIKNEVRPWVSEKEIVS